MIVVSDVGQTFANTGPIGADALCASFATRAFPEDETLGIVVTSTSPINPEFSAFLDAASREKVRITPTLSLNIEASRFGASLASHLGTKGPVHTIIDPCFGWMGYCLAMDLLSACRAMHMLIVDLSPDRTEGWHMVLTKGGFDRPAPRCAIRWEWTQHKIVKPCWDPLAKHVVFDGDMKGMAFKHGIAGGRPVTVTFKRMRAS